MEATNARIRGEICYNTLEELTDAKLMPEYLSCSYLYFQQYHK